MLFYFLNVFFVLALGVGAVDAAEYATVTPQQFQTHNFWVWRYFEFRSPENKWQAYLDERYTVVSIEGPIITIEMQSSSVGHSQMAPAHHKFILDFRKCELEAQNPTYRNWTVQFYTKSITGSWTLVSASHKNAVFTEKFNCSKLRSTDIESVWFKSAEFKAFRKRGPSDEETSWYFLNHPELMGVASSKLFKPDDLYRQQLVDFGSVEER